MKLFTLEFATSSSRTAVRCGSRAVIEANITLNLNPSLRDADVREGRMSGRYRGAPSAALRGCGAVE